MSRPLAAVGFSCLGALVLCSLCGAAVGLGLSVLFCAAAAVAFLLFRSGKAGRAAALVLLTAGLSMAGYAAVFALRARPALALSGKTAVVTGVVLDGPAHTNSYYYYTLKLTGLSFSDGAQPAGAVSTRVRAGFRLPLTAKPYDTVRFTARLSAPGGGTGYQSAVYSYSKGIFLLAWQQGTDEPAVTENPRPPLLYWAAVARNLIHDRIAASVAGQPGLFAAGILIGDTRGLDEEIQNDFTADGVSHLLAVSGTQTSLIAQCLLLLLCALKVPRRGAAAAGIAAVAAFMAVTGFVPSVSRAGVMSMLYLLGLVVGRQPDALNSLGASVLALCALNPFAAADVGLQLSFAATLGMILVSGPLLRRCARPVRRLPVLPRKLALIPIGVLCETAGASLLTLPILLVTFHNLSLISPLANLVEVPLSFVVTLSSAALAVFFPLVFLRLPLAALTGACCTAMIGAAHGLASLPFAQVSADYGFAYLLLAFALCAGGAWALFRRLARRDGKPAPNPLVPVVCVAFAVSCGALSYSVAHRNVLEIDCLSVGNGSATVLLYNGRAAVVGLSGTDPAGRVAALLRARNVSSLSALVLPSYSRETVDAANALLRDYPCPAVVCPESYRGSNDGFLQLVNAPCSLSLWAGCPFYLLPQGRDRLAAAVCPGTGSVLLLPDGGSPSASAAAALHPGLVVFGGTVDAQSAQRLAPSLAVSGGGTAALYSCPGFSVAGAKVLRTSEGAVRLQTRDGVQFRVG